MPTTAPRSPAGPLELALLLALQADPPDPRAVQSARLALVRKWDDLAWKQAGRWFRGNNSRGSIEDYHAAAVLGLWEASLKFDPARGHVFATFAGWYMLKHLKFTAHHEAAGGHHVPCSHGITHVPTTPFSGIGAPNGYDGERDFGNIVPDHRAPDPDDDVPPLPSEFWAAVDAAVPNPRERLVLRRRYVDGWTLDEVARELKVGKERVRQIQENAVGRLRLGREGFVGFVAG